MRMKEGTLAANMAIWEAPPGARRGEQTRSRPQKSLASVIAQGDDGERSPLLIVTPYGDGRSAALAVDSTWLWQMQGFGDVHRRFWRQLVLWLAKKDETAGEHVWVRLDQRRFQQGSRVDFKLGAEDTEGAPSKAPTSPCRSKSLMERAKRCASRPAVASRREALAPPRSPATTGSSSRPATRGRQSGRRRRGSACRTKMWNSTNMGRSRSRCSMISRGRRPNTWRTAWAILLLGHGRRAEGLDHHAHRAPPRRWRRRPAPRSGAPGPRPPRSWRCSGPCTPPSGPPSTGPCPRRRRRRDGPCRRRCRR